jgi:hypothetical protein
MTATTFNTENRTYRQLLGNGLIYRIPRFQRDYSWDEEEWEDLWMDLLGTFPIDGEPAHYMGYLVLQTSDNRTFEVIDGQQRLTTASLIVLAALRLLARYSREGENSEANQKRAEQLRATYIGYLDPVTLTARNKLALNRNNDGYYRDYLVTLAGHLPQRGFPVSTQTMRKGFEWFEAHLIEHVKGDLDPGRALAQFVESMSDKLFFTVITVADEINAYKVFETLNARGVRLSATDLLKNYLFSLLARNDEASHDMDELERRWESMVDRLGSESFPDFLRMHWNSRHSFARQSELFKVIRNRIGSRESVFTLLRNMDEDIDTYLALTQPDGSTWRPAFQESVRELRLFSVRQPYPVLMAAKRRLSEDDFGSLLRAIVVIAFRYNVIGSQHTSEQERIYHAAAVQLDRGEARSLMDVLTALRQIYRSDNAFRADFAEKVIKTTQTRNARIVRYIMFRLEKQNSGMDFEVDSVKYSIEHVLPQSVDAGWDLFHDRDLETFVYRLGNMAMIEAGKNREIGNEPYALKRPVLQSSDVPLTSRLASENAEWTPERIEARQKSLAAIATNVWRISQLT